MGVLQESKTGSKLTKKKLKKALKLIQNYQDSKTISVTLVFIIQFGLNSHLVLIYLLLNLNMSFFNKIFSIVQALKLFHILQDGGRILNVNLLYESYIYVLYTKRFFL